MANNEVKMTIKADSQQFLKNIRQCGEAVKGLDRAIKNLKVNVNTVTAKKKITAFVSAVDTIKVKPIQVEVDTAAALEKIRILTSRLQSMKIVVLQDALAASRSSRLPQRHLSGITDSSGALEPLKRQDRQTQGRLDRARTLRGSGEGQSGNQSESAGEAFGGGLFDTFSKTSAVAAGVKEVMMQIKDLAAAVVMPGFHFTGEMETAKLGIAGVLSSMATLNGEALEFNTAMGLSDDIFAALQKDAVRTSATTAELVETFRALAAPGLHAGGTIEEIERFTTSGVNAAKSMGLPKDQMVQELSDLVAGDISEDSTIAKTLGLTGADLEAAKNSAEGLFTFLEARMSGLAEAAKQFPDTLSGKLSALEETSTLASAELTKAVEPEIKAMLGFITGLLAEINTETGELELNPALLEGIETVKDGLDAVLSLFGEINQTTGNFELSEGTAEVFDALGSGLQSIWDVAESLAVALDQIFNNEAFSYLQDYWLPVLGDLWSIFIDIISIVSDAIRALGNLGGKVLEVAAPFQEQFAGAIKWAAGQLKEFVEMARIGWEWLVKWSGGRKELKITRKESFQPKEVEKPAKQTDTSGIRAKYPAGHAAEKAGQERVKQAKEALKEMLGYWKKQLDLIQSAFKKRQDELKLLLDQDAISTDQYYTELLRTEIEAKKAELSAIEGKIASVESAGLPEAEKESQLESLHDERALITALVADLEKAFAEMVMELSRYNTMTPNQAAAKYHLDAAGFEAPFLTEKSGAIDHEPASLAKMEEVKLARVQEQKALPQAGSGEGDTWYKVAEENPKYDAMEDKAKIALEAVAKYFKALTGQQLGLTSGKRSGSLGYSQDEIGGHFTGLKFDATAEALNDPEIRQKVIDFARSIGLQVLDEYANPTRNATGRHLDFDAAGFEPDTTKTTGFNIERTGIMHYRQSYEAVQARTDMRSQAAEVLKKYNEMMLGDVSACQIAEIEAHYEKVRRKLKKYENDELARSALDKLDKLIAGEKLKLNFAQAQKDIEAAFDDAERKQKQSFEKITFGSSEFLAIANTAAKEYLNSIENERSELKEMLEAARKNGWKDVAKNISDLLDRINENIAKYYDNSLAKLDEALARKIALIESNPKLTTLQKKDLSEEANRKYLQDALENKRAKREDLYNLAGTTTSIDFEIANLENQLNGLGSALDKVHQAAAQAFEDGLLEFLERGIFECESLGEALRELAITVLESIQKIFAEDMTNNIMVSLGFGDAYKKQKEENTALDGTALANQFGTITAQTNHFLVSFDGQMFQFAEKAQTAFNGILQTIHSAVNAVPTVLPSLNLGVFSTSSLAGNSDSFYNSSYGNNWWEGLSGYAEGGSTTQGDNGGYVNGPGTETSDSILAMIGHKIVRIAKGEYVFNAAAVRRVGTNFLDRLNSGDIYNLPIKIPKFAGGGAVGNIGANAAARGMQSFAQDLGVNVSPQINVNNYVDGQRIFNQYGKPLIRSEAKKEILENLKMYMQLGKRFNY